MLSPTSQNIILQIDKHNDNKGPLLNECVIHPNLSTQNKSNFTKYVLEGHTRNSNYNMIHT